MNKIIFNKEKTLDNYASERAQVVKNKLLGDYNKNNSYIISDKVVEELIAIKKIRKSSYGNSIFCGASLSSGTELSFEILFKKNSKLNLAVAELYVLEVVEKINGYILNTMKTPIAKFSEKLSDKFVDRALMAFNISLNANAGEGRLMNEEEDIHTRHIKVRRAFLSVLDDLTDINYEKAYENYFNKRIALLKNQKSIYSNEVLEHFNNEYNKIEKFFLVNKKGEIKFRVLNELLDKAFEDINGTSLEFAAEERKYKEKINNFMVAFATNLRNIEDTASITAKDLVNYEISVDDVNNVVAERERIYNTDDKQITDINRKPVKDKPATILEGSEKKPEAKKESKSEKSAGGGFEPGFADGNKKKDKPEFISKNEGTDIAGKGNEAVNKTTNLGKKPLSPEAALLTENIIKKTKEEAKEKPEKEADKTKDKAKDKVKDTVAETEKSTDSKITKPLKEEAVVVETIEVADRKNNFLPENELLSFFEVNFTQTKISSLKTGEVLAQMNKVEVNQTLVDVSQTQSTNPQPPIYIDQGKEMK